MTRIVPLPSDEVTPFLNDYLKQGRSLSSDVLEKVDFASGRIIAILPEGWPDEGCLQFSTGLGIDPVDTRALLLDHLHSFLTESSDYVVVFEDALGKLSDPAVEQRDTTLYRFHGEDVFSLVESDQVSLETLDEAVRLVRGYLMLGVVSRVPRSWESSDKKLTFTGEDLVRLSAGAVALVFEAYDGEGYLVWTSDEAPSPPSDPS